MNYITREGDYQKMGARVGKDGIFFTFAAEREDDCKIVLFDKNTMEKQEVPVEKNFCKGALRSVAVIGLKSRTCNYLYEINGILQEDPYATALVGREKWKSDAEPIAQNRAMCTILRDHFDWKDDRHPEVPKSKMFLYKLHVRGFSMAASWAGKDKGTFRAISKKIPYFKELGVTTLELMPAYEFDECPVPNTPVNFWGYGPGNYFVPKASYARNPFKASEEFKKLIRDLHANGMECVMEMCFPPEVPRTLITDALEYWVEEYHVDGFHLLGAHLPIGSIVQNPRLGRTKIFVDDYYGMPNTRGQKNLFLYKEEYQYPIRMLLNGGKGDVVALINQQKKQNRDFGFVNFLASNNGFTLEDVFSYEDKHNEENGENNCDGPEYNYSSNCGAEGATKRKKVIQKRTERKRAALMTLFLAQGVPMIQAGDEFGNTQFGNNNAYCQDNETGWLTWKNFSRTGDVRELIRKLMDFRNQYSVIANDAPYRFHDYKAKGIPDVSYHGEVAWLSQVDPGMRSVGILYNGAYAEQAPEHPDVYIGYNFEETEVQLALPKRNWDMLLPEVRSLGEVRFVSVAPCSVCILTAK